MPSRSLIIQLQAGVQQAILPDHRKMLPGVQYVVDYDTFSKLSPGARQNMIQVVAVNTDATTTSGSYVPAQTDSTYNTQLNIFQVLSTVSTSPVTYNAAGFAAQGWVANASGPTGIGASPGFQSFALTGPAGERYEYVYNYGPTISGAGVAVWYDEDSRVATANRPSFQVFQDGQGTQFQQSVNVTTVIPGQVPATQIGTKQGQFAGVALVAIPSGNYGWLQVEGYCPAVIASGIFSAGATLAVGQPWQSQYQAATTEVVGANQQVTGTAFSNNVFGTALAAVSGVATIAADLRSVTKAKKPYVRFLNKN